MQQRPCFMQYAAAMSASLIMFTTGTFFGWIGPTIQKLLATDSSIQTTYTEASWLASLLSMGSILGPALGATAADCLGRKTAILLAAIPYLISWIMIATAGSVWTLIISRFISGMSMGASYTIIPMYMGEIAIDSIRGKLGTFLAIAINLGMLFEYSIVPFVSISVNAEIAAIIPLLLLLTFSWMPESPYYLLANDSEEKARNALVTLRGTKDVENDLTMIKNALKNQEEEKSSLLDLVTVKSNRKALLIVMGLLTVQQASGVAAVIAYGHTIFQQSGADLSPAASGIVLATFSLCTVAACAFLVDKIGRRPLLLFSATTTIVPLAMVGIFFYLQSINYAYVDKISLIPTIALVAFKLTTGVGIDALPYIVLAELFPTNLKALASGVVIVYASICQFAVAKSYPLVAAALGTHTVFFGFAMACAISVLFIAICLPETKGKPLHEIQQMLKGADNQCNHTRTKTICA